MIKVFVDGREGTTGLRIIERLSERDDIELMIIPEELRKNADERKKYILNSDVTFLCLPDVAAREAADLAAGADTVIIDASTAHRTEQGWAYGFPELSPEFRKNISVSNRIAVPGCHASGFVSLVYPLVKSGVADGNYPFVCHSLTGFSGGGKKMIAAYNSDKTDILLESPRQYALGQEHKHQKEMKYICSLSRTPVFNPIVDDYYSGMEVSVPLYSDLLNASVLNKYEGENAAQKVHKLFSEWYNGCEFIKVMPFADEECGGFLAANELSGKDTMRIYVFGNDERVLTVSVFDNLGKGASGAAVQCMNIALKMNESLSLAK